MCRRDFIRDFGWCIPDARMIEEVAHFIGDRRALSVGAGRALFELLLHDRGVNIVATDSFDEEWRYTHEPGPFMPVHEYSAAHAVRVFDPDVLVWYGPRTRRASSIRAFPWLRMRCVRFADTGWCMWARTPRAAPETGTFTSS